MKKIKYVLVVIMTGLFIFSGSAIFAENIVVLGIINSEYQLVSDSGKIYEIGENQKGEELMELEGKKVEVNGKVIKNEDDEDSLVLMVTEFKIKG